MPYSAEICRTNPTCFIFLVDQSDSMKHPIGGSVGKSKAEGLADAINRLLQTLVIRCTKGPEVLDRYHIGVLGYGNRTGPALVGALAGKDLAPVGEIARHPLRVESRTQKLLDGAGGVIQQTVKFPVWLEPMARARTPMCAALDQAWMIANNFILQWPDCFPPMVLNLSDGEASDGDPLQRAKMIQELASSDGNVLLFNLHLSSRQEPPIQFPSSEQGLPDNHARRLFRMSSPLPPAMVKAAEGRVPVSEGARGFVFNADLISVIEFLDIGTRADWDLPLEDG